MVTGLLTDRRLRSWLSGAVLTTWSLTLKTVEMTVDFRRTPPRSPPTHPPLTITNSSVTAVESFRFLGSTISQDLKWDSHTESMVKKAQQRLYFLRQLRNFNLPQELLIQFYSAIIESILCTSITVWFSSATKSDLRRLQRVVQTAERIIGTTLPTLQELYSSRVSKRTGKITLDPHIQHTLSLSGYCLVDATELWAPERPDTETVSSLRQSISWTLDIKHGTHNTVIQLFIHHTLIFSFQICTSDLTHNCLYCTLCFYHFVHCPCILLHCGASVTITNSSYAWTYLAKKVHSDSDSNNITILPVLFLFDFLQIFYQAQIIYGLCFANHAI